LKQTPEACAAICRELGLTFVELNMNLPEYKAEAFDVEGLRKIAEEYGIFYTIHLDENLNPCDFNSAIAAAYTETVLRAIKIAKRLSVPLLNMHLHSGVYFTLPDRKVYLFEEYEDDYLQKLTCFRDACTAAIGDTGIKICIENCGDFGENTLLTKGLELLLQSPVFALTFDIGHNAAADYIDEPVIMKHAGRLCHMHIHDAKGAQNHLTLGSGDVDLQKYLEIAIAHNCTAVLEVKTLEGLQRSFDWIKYNVKGVTTT